MKQFILILTFGFMEMTMFAQSNICSNDPPLNPYLANTPWPIFHRNNYAQSSTCMPGPAITDSLYVISRASIQGGSSPWVYLSKFYPDSSRALLFANATHAFKFVDTGAQLVVADSIQLSFDPVNSFLWTHLIASNGDWFINDSRYNPQFNLYSRIFRIRDSNPNNVYSSLQNNETFNFGTHGINNKVNHLSLNYLGQIVFNSDVDTVNNIAVTGVIGTNPTFQLLDTLKYTTYPGEIVSHNAFPIDENNSYYVVTTHRLIKFDWDGNNLTMGYEAFYDFVNDGPTGNFAKGSGTTPTLLGWGVGNDKLVVMADGHANNNLVAFWRELPPNWTPIPGMSPYFADSIRLPGAISTNNTFQSIENSPCALGYSIGIAQFNGFLGQPCPTQKGVQKVSWNTLTKQLELDWVNTNVNFNGVPVVSSQTGLVYGTGRKNNSTCSYYYYALDWQTGALVFEKYLGEQGTLLNNTWDDGGVNHAIDEKGNIYYSGGASLVKIGRIPLTTNVVESEFSHSSIFLYPNPSNGLVYVSNDSFNEHFISIYSLLGDIVKTSKVENGFFDISDLPNGLYLAKVTSENKEIILKLIKNGL
jgi:hypothetical protein